ncbi:hypothetical protein PVA44_06410 [Entomospira nematocerorum]|nr:hypothetical protein [Entomospira nematocera]WDI33849.1 hypothetical protein PVA44_06410 [Entomospira nematocera]
MRLSTSEQQLCTIIDVSQSSMHESILSNNINYNLNSWYFLLLI